MGNKYCLEVNKICQIKMEKDPEEGHICNVSQVEKAKKPGTKKVIVGELYGKSKSKLVKKAFLEAGMRSTRYLNYLVLHIEWILLSWCVCLNEL